MVNIQYYLPSWKKLRSSLRLRSREFLRENTLHGFAYFVNPRRPLWDRTFWFIATMASIGSSIFMMATIYNTFQSQPTLTRLDTETEELVTYFPGLTLCGVNQTMNLGRYEGDSEHYNLMYHWSWHVTDTLKPEIPLTGETYSEFFYRITPECKDLYENCTYFGKEVPCATIFEKQIFGRGICCSSKATQMTKETGSRAIEFDSKIFPISLDLLTDGDRPPGRHAAFTYLLQSGTTVGVSIKFTYSTPGVEALRKSQRACLFPEEDLSYGICFQKCVKKRILEKCQCLPWFMMMNNNTIECSLAQYSCITNNVSKIFTNCKCYLSCNHTTYNLEQIDMFKNNRVRIAIPNWPNVTFKRDIRFGWLDLLVSFGGIAGVCVGYSLLTTVELAYYMILRTYCGAVLDGSDNTIKAKVKKSKKAPRLRVINVEDLKKGYYNYVQ